MVAEHLADQVLRDTLGFFFGIRSGAQAVWQWLFVFSASLCSLR